VLEQFEQQKIQFDQQRKDTQQTQSEQTTQSYDSVEETKQPKEQNDIQTTHTSTDNIKEDVDSYKAQQREVLADVEANDTMDDTLNYEDEVKDKVTSSPARRVPYMEVVGQVHGTYIIAQNENGMFMIDQHAAQERIKYEYFRDKIGDVSNEVQNLLIPLTFHFSKDELMIIEQYKDELS
jgi:DNA mismatch repair protein MutL